MIGQNKGTCVRPQGCTIWNVNMQMLFGGGMGTGSGRIQCLLALVGDHGMIIGYNLWTIW